MTPPAALPISADPRWTAVLARDARADGRFVYAVRTTGVWCHPSSPTRRPRPGNVEFFDTPAAAEAAGYRPSRRAAPARLPSSTAVTKTFIASMRSMEPPSLGP